MHRLSLFFRYQASSKLIRLSTSALHTMETLPNGVKFKPGVCVISMGNKRKLVFVINLYKDTVMFYLSRRFTWKFSRTFMGTRKMDAVTAWKTYWAWMPKLIAKCLARKGMLMLVWNTQWIQLLIFPSKFYFKKQTVQTSQCFIMEKEHTLGTSSGRYFSSFALFFN